MPKVAAGAFVVCLVMSYFVAGWEVHGPTSTTHRQQEHYPPEGYGEEIGQPPPTLSDSSSRRHERVVVDSWPPKCTGMHHPAEGMLKQWPCLFIAAYNFRAQYDVVVFATGLTFLPTQRCQTCKRLCILQGSRVIVPDSMGVEEEVLSLSERDRALFLSQCNTAIDQIDKMGATEAWFMGFMLHNSLTESTMAGKLSSGASRHGSTQRSQSIVTCHGSIQMHSS